jgi:hypothetical protein
MIISIINRTRTLADEKVQRAIRAINRQIAQDFEPYWSFGATLRLEGNTGARSAKRELSDMRGDAIIYLCNRIDAEDADGYHDTYDSGIPYGFVLTDLALDPSWTVTLSHEALELIADPQGNMLVKGPHPKHRNRNVFHWFEMCDAVQDEWYAIDGVKVSNFVLPLYFTPGEQRDGRNDFLGRRHGGKTLRSFGINPGGYIGFYDPHTRKDQTVDADRRAALRRARKRKAGFTRSVRRGVMAD